MQQRMPTDNIGCLLFHTGRITSTLLTTFNLWIVQCEKQG